MDFINMQKAILLAENINDFIKFVQQNGRDNFLHPDKLYQIKLWMEDFKFQIIADELLRINQFDWDEKYTFYLVSEFKKGLYIISEYVKNHYSDLFLITARLHTLMNLSTILTHTVEDQLPD